MPEPYAQEDQQVSDDDAAELAAETDRWFEACGYYFCRPCGEYHRPPECAIDEDGVPELDWADEDEDADPYEGRATCTMIAVEREYRPIVPRYHHDPDATDATFGTFTDHQWAVTRWAHPDYL